MYQKIFRLNEDFTKKTLDWQVLDSNHRYYGGIIDPISGVALPSHGNTPRIMATWVGSLLNVDSEFYQDINLLQKEQWR